MQSEQVVQHGYVRERENMQGSKQEDPKEKRDA